MIIYFIDTESNQPYFNTEQQNLTADECKDTLCNIFVPDNCTTLQLTFLLMIFNKFLSRAFFGNDLQFNLSVLLREERSKRCFSQCNLAALTERIIRKPQQLISEGTIERYMKTKSFMKDLHNQSLWSKRSTYFVCKRYSASEIVTADVDR